MKRSLAVSVLLAMVGSTLIVPAALADDFAPPWYRGHELSTRSAWEFAQPPTSFFDIYADSFTAVAGPPQYPLFMGFPAKAEVDLATNWTWVPGDGDGGLTPAPGVPVASLGFKIPNFIDDLDIKLLRVQLTYQVVTPVGNFHPSVPGVQGWLGFNGTIGPVQGVPEGALVFLTTVHAYQDWTISPNPTWDLIAISVPANVILDEVVIDTVSLPAPGSVALLALGSVILAASRRRT